jgi:hypothetical protein
METQKMTDDVVDKACCILACRWNHLGLWNLMDYAMGASEIDTTKCEYGNDAEHRAFYGVENKGNLAIDKKSETC